MKFPQLVTTNVRETPAGKWRMHFETIRRSNVPGCVGSRLPVITTLRIFLTHHWTGMFGSNEIPGEVVSALWNACQVFWWIAVGVWFCLGNDSNYLWCRIVWGKNGVVFFFVPGGSFSNGIRFFSLVSVFFLFFLRCFLIYISFTKRTHTSNINQFHPTHSDLFGLFPARIISVSKFWKIKFETLRVRESFEVQ